MSRGPGSLHKTPKSAVVLCLSDTFRPRAMEAFQNWISKISKDVKAASDKASSSSSSSSSSFEAPCANEGLAAALSDQSRVIVARPVRGVVSLWTCSKFCALAFVAGIIVGYTLKQRVKRWANKLLKKIRDD